MPVVEALFFGLKAAVLAIVLEAVVRIGRRALKNRVHDGDRRRGLRRHLLLRRPFPLIILAAGLIGLAGGRAGLPAFIAAGGHPGLGDRHDQSDAASALGEATPAHARPALAWSLQVAAVCLLLWLGPVLRCC